MKLDTLSYDLQTILPLHKMGSQNTSSLKIHTEEKLAETEEILQLMKDYLAMNEITGNRSDPDTKYRYSLFIF